MSEPGEPTNVQFNNADLKYAKQLAYKFKTASILNRSTISKKYYNHMGKLPQWKRIAIDKQLKDSTTLQNETPSKNINLFLDETYENVPMSMYNKRFFNIKWNDTMTLIYHKPKDGDMKNRWVEFKNAFIPTRGIIFKEPTTPYMDKNNEPIKILYKATDRLSADPLGTRGTDFVISASKYEFNENTGTYVIKKETEPQFINSPVKQGNHKIKDLKIALSDSSNMTLPKLQEIFGTIIGGKSRRSKQSRKAKKTQKRRH